MRLKPWARWFHLRRRLRGRAARGKRRSPREYRVLSLFASANLMFVSASRVFLWLAILAFAQAADAAASSPSAEPAYVVRGRQTETRQRALKERLERFSQRLSDAFRLGAPDLL